MRILHCIPALIGGGIKTFVCQLCNEQAHLGHDVNLCTIYKPEQSAYAYSWMDSAVHIHDLGKKQQGFSLKEVFAIYKFIRNGNYHVVNIHGYFYYYFLAICLLHNRVSFFYTVHSDARQENTHWDKRLLPLKRLFFRLGWIHPITISKASESSFEALYRSRGTLIYNGVALPMITPNTHYLEKYKLTPSTRLFIHVGRITRAKNQVLLCKVFSRLIQQGHDVALIIIGQQQDNRIYNAIQQYFSDRIQYIGERDNAVEFMSEAEALCLPSIWEGMPITLLEALSVGCPTIATPVGGVPEVIIDNENGFLSSNNTEEAYFNTMLRFLQTDKRTLNSIRKRCKTTFKHFDIATTAQQYIATYQHTPNEA